jgi:hypothetical protein
MNKEKLQEALDDGKSLNEISKEWGASLTNLRYWCKKYDLKSQYSSFSAKGKIKRSSRNVLKYENLDWSVIQNCYDNGCTWRDISKKFKINNATLTKYVKLGFLKTRTSKETFKLFPKSRPKTSEDVRKKMSEKRKQFLKENPDKHPWRKPNKHISEPCNKAKEFLKLLGVDFIEEFSPEIEGRFFSIDIAIPDKMIAIEINGGQHYSKEGSLKPYYQERHDLIEKAGWKVFEIHCRSCFKLEKWEEFAEIIKSSSRVKDFDYFNYEPKNKKISICDTCNGNKKTSNSKSCGNCSRRKNKVNIKTSKV